MWCSSRYAAVLIVILWSATSIVSAGDETTDSGDDPYALEDYAAFAACFAGPAVIHPFGQGCQSRSYDLDLYVDLGNFSKFRRFVGTTASPGMSSVPRGTLFMGDALGDGIVMKATFLPKKWTHHSLFRCRGRFLSDVPFSILILAQTHGACDHTHD
jgi:hypothetical protein